MEKNQKKLIGNPEKIPYLKKKRTDEQTNERANGPTKKRTNKQTNKLTHVKLLDLSHETDGS